MDVEDRARDQWTSLAVDGKTLLRSERSRNGQRPLHLATAFSMENSLVLGQMTYGEKSNEITTIPELQELLKFEKPTVTIDTIYYEKDIAAQICQHKGHFVLGLKRISLT